MSIQGVVITQNGTAATINVQSSGGTNMNTTAFDAASAPGTKNLGVNVPTLGIGDYLVLAVVGTPTFAASVGNITVFVS